MLLQYVNFEDWGKKEKLLLKDKEETKRLRKYLMNMGSKIGWEPANTVLLNMAVANIIRYPTSIDSLFLASPVLPWRLHTDPNFFKITREWKGGYPWPYSHFIIEPHEFQEDESDEE